MSQQSSITSVDIPREAPRNFVIGGGRTAGGVEGSLWGIGCGWRMSRLRWLARRVNVTTPSKVRCRSTGCALSLSRALVAGNIGDNVMRMQRARYRGFNALRDGSRFVVTESAAVSDRRYARRNFQFPNLLRYWEFEIRHLTWISQVLLWKASNLP